MQQKVVTIQILPELNSRSNQKEEEKSLTGNVIIVQYLYNNVSHITLY